MTRWKLHVEKWSKEGCGSDMCRGANKIVLARGSIPCDVLFVGEAPGESENVLGMPFVGPAGKLLTQIVKRGLPAQYRAAFTNVVCCIPREEVDRAKKAHEPDYDQVMACKPRLQEFVELADVDESLKLIVRVGKIPAEYLDPTWKDAVKFHRPIPMVDLTHPAHILRANVAQQGLMIQRCVVVLSTAVDDFLTAK